MDTQKITTQPGSTEMAMLSKENILWTKLMAPRELSATHLIRSMDSKPWFTELDIHILMHQKLITKEDILIQGIATANSHK